MNRNDLHFVEQTNHVTAKFELCKLSREKVCGVNTEGFLAFDSRHMHATKSTCMLCSQATIMMEKN